MARKLVYLGISLYFLVLTFLMFRHNLWFSPDQFVIVALILAIFLGRGKKFIYQWTPFILLFLGYEALRGLNPEITKIPINITNVIDLERFLFGIIPSNYLQTLLFNPKSLQFYDFYFSIIYMSHFVAFLLYAFILWWRKHGLFNRFTYSLVILSYLAFFTFLFFPVMPPWMAADQGFLPQIHRIMYLTTPIYTQPGPQIPTIYSIFAANKTAAIPSLHAAYPFLLFIFSLRLKRKWVAIPAGIYMLSVWFAVVYLGEHYVIDILIALIYVLVSVKIVDFLSDKRLEKSTA